MSGQNKFFENYKRREPLRNDAPPQQAEPPSGGKKSGFQIDRRIVYGAAALALAITVLIASLSMSGVRAEDLKGWSYSDAELWASQNSVYLRVDSVYNDEIEQDRVISQGSESGQKLKKGGFLQLTVSKGHDPSVAVDVPNFGGMTAASIKEWADNNYMTKVRITSEKNSSLIPGSIIRYEINDATLLDPKKVRRDSPIYIVVATQQEAKETVTLENMVGKPQADAGAYAGENGFELKITEEFNESIPFGQVMTQSILAGETIFKGDVVEITVSKGKKIAIPDFSEFKTKEQAQAKAAALGVAVAVKDAYSAKKIGAFVSQSAKAGSIYERDDVIELSYSLGSTLPIPSFVGQTVADIESWMAPLNALGAKLTLSSTTTKGSQPKGTVIHQDKRNVTASLSTSISVVVSSGNVVFVPQFTSTSHTSYDSVILREEAMRMCEQAGLVPIFVAEERSGVLPGEIWSQSEAAAAEIAEGSRITLRYRPVTQSYTVPNFVGMTAAQVKAGTYGANLTIRYEGDADGGGKVTAQSIKPNAKAAMGSAITLTVGAAALAPEPEGGGSTSPGAESASPGSNSAIGAPVGASLAGDEAGGAFWHE
ncbi:MAG: PASTA domain-containing protein [Eubacteriaceae bacterium]|jgi:serine/threonine-protein kinase|nr:PASTA domain-containing protein [Eubacteriaceae bacterium]